MLPKWVTGCLPEWANAAAAVPQIAAGLLHTTQVGGLGNKPGRDLRWNLRDLRKPSLQRGLTGQRHHIVLRAGAAADADGADQLAIHQQRISAA